MSYYHFLSEVQCIFYFFFWDLFLELSVLFSFQVFRDLPVIFLLLILIWFMVKTILYKNQFFSICWGCFTAQAIIYLLCKCFRHFKINCILLLGGMSHKYIDINLYSDHTSILADLLSILSFKYLERGLKPPTSTLYLSISPSNSMLTSRISQPCCLVHTHLSSWWIDSLILI